VLKDKNQMNRDNLSNITYESNRNLRNKMIALLKYKICVPETKNKNTKIRGDTQTEKDTQADRKVIT
jgi:hypothetical protein